MTPGAKEIAALREAARQDPRNAISLARMAETLLHAGDMAMAVTLGWSTL